MLELKLRKDSLFLNVLEAILDLVDVAKVDYSSTGLKLQAVDTEHAAMIALFFPAEDLKNYHCDEYISMGISIEDMVKAIRCADKDDTITFKIGDESFDAITLSFESPKENGTTVLDLLFVNANSQCFQIQDWEVLDSYYQAFVKMPSAEFMRVCKGLSNISDEGHISVTEKGVKFFASGESRHVDIVLPATDITMRAPISLTLDLKYMNSFVKASTLFDQVRIGLSTTVPLMIECEIGEMGYVRYFLALVATEIEEEEIKGSGEEKEGSKEIKGQQRKESEG